MDLHPHPSLTAIRCNSVPASPGGFSPEGLARHPLSFSPEQICTRTLLQQQSAAILFPRVQADSALKALRGILYPSARNRFAHTHPAPAAIRCNSVPASPDGSVPEGLAGHPLSFSPEQICTGDPSPATSEAFYLAILNEMSITSGNVLPHSAPLRIPCRCEPADHFGSDHFGIVGIK